MFVCSFYYIDYPKSLLLTPHVVVLFCFSTQSGDAATRCGYYKAEKRKRERERKLVCFSQTRFIATVEHRCQHTRARTYNETNLPQTQRAHVVSRNTSYSEITRVLTSSLAPEAEETEKSSNIMR